MKSVSKNTTYVPNRDVKELMLILKGELKKISGSDIIDGVYVKNKKTTSKMPQSSVSEILEKLKSIQKENDAELGIGETEIKELLNAGFNAKDIEIIYSGYSPSSVNADTEFGNTTSGFISSYADYQKRGVKSIVESASQGMYEIGLKYPDFNWKSIIDKYKIKSTPKIVTKSIRDYEYKYEVYFGNGIAIGHSIAYKSGSEAWQDEGNAIGELTSKTSKFQKDKSYKAGFNGGYWGIVVKSKDAVYSIVDDLLKQSGSYVKDLELFENRLGGIGINEVKNEKFAKGGGVGKSEEEVWNNWSVEQRKHFLKDHRIFTNKEQDHRASLYRFDELPTDLVNAIKSILKEHISEVKYANGGGVGKNKKPKYKIGQLVYSYQNKDTKYPINYIKDADDLGIIRYRISLPDGNSNWINEEGIYTNSISGEKMAKGGGFSSFMSNVKSLRKTGLSKTKEAYGKTKEYVKGKVHDQKKKIALDVIYDAKENLPIKREEINALDKAFRVVEEKYAKGGGVGDDYISNELYDKLDKITDWKIVRQKEHRKNRNVVLVLSKSGKWYKISVVSNGKEMPKMSTYYTTKQSAENSFNGTITKFQLKQGGGVGKKRSLMSMANLVDWKGEGIKKWYMRSYPTDELGEELNDDVTFKDLWDALNNKQDVYEIMGVADSVVRERLFQYLSLVYDVDYDVVYKKWLNSDDYANGGGVGSQFEYTIGGL